eukprot:TRINITY_DN77095_c0_g1_i1.p1 TRINITY_DN77095_c0_g1~~TRINITY_DN77095_c0_g1_i1.p1  ORF type:complete len:296 (+),score=41.86 TRINITY_DN77095_c0_g1_i1:52-888(+)
MMEFPPVVDLLVGGDRFVTALSTLRKFPDSMLAAMFSGSVGVQKKDGAYFIDRSGDTFACVLEYLRDGSTELPVEPEQLRRLLKDASFYGLSGLEELVQDRLRMHGNVLVALYEGSYGCSKDECRCGSPNVSLEEELMCCPDYEARHPNKRQVPPVLGSPFLTLVVSVESADGAAKSLEFARNAVMACLDDRFGSVEKDVRPWAGRQTVKANLDTKLSLLATRLEVNHCEIVESVRPYYVGDLRDGDFGMIKHYESWLKISLDRQPAESVLVKRRRCT